MKPESIIRSLALAVCLTPAVHIDAQAQIIKSVAGNPWYAYRVAGLNGSTWVHAHDTIVGGQWAVRYSHQNDAQLRGGAGRGDMSVATGTSERPDTEQVAQVQTFAATSMDGTTTSVASLAAVSYRTGSAPETCSSPEARPPFALSYIVPTTGLQDGSVIRYRAYSCGRFAGRINAVDGDAVVTSGSAARGPGDDESAWVLTGTGPRRFVAWIAKSDMRVLRVSDR